MRAGLLGLVALVSAHAAQPEEVARFWRATVARLAQEPMEAAVEPVKEALPYRKFRVTLRGLDGVKFRAYLALPIRGEGPLAKLAAVITVPGYGGSQQGVMLDECQRGYAIMQVFPRSQGESEELWKIDGPEKLTWHIAKPEGYYYQGAYADMLRGIDYLASRDDVDRDRIGAMGTSQGGGMVIALAAIDPRVKAVVAHVPFLCDVRQAVHMPGTLVGKLLNDSKTAPQALDTLDYFDPLQLAPQVRVPVLVSSGGKDTVCPATTIHAVFERLPGIKSLAHYPDLPHTSCLDFYSMGWNWIDRYLR